jgi:hypothetical protein
MAIKTNRLRRGIHAMKVNLTRGIQNGLVNGASMIAKLPDVHANREVRRLNKS